MKPADVRLPGKRKRGRYSNEFKQELVKACEAPGVSTASVALANGVNANLLRRWVSELRGAEVRQLEAVFGRFWLFLRCAVMMDQWLRSVLTINSCSSKAITPTIDEVRLPALQ